MGLPRLADLELWTAADGAATVIEDPFDTTPHAEKNNCCTATGHIPCSCMLPSTATSWATGEATSACFTCASYGATTVAIGQGDFR